MLQLEDRLISFFKTVEDSLSTNFHKALDPKGFPAWSNVYFSKNP